MLCSLCNSWFYLIRNCPEKPRGNFNFEDTVTNEAEIESLYKPNDAQHEPVMYQNMDRSYDEYNFTPVEEDKEIQQTKAEQLDTLFLNLACNIETEYNNPHNVYVHHCRPNAEPDPKMLRKLHPTLEYDDQVSHHRLYFDEKAPHSVTRLNQWMAYLPIHHVPNKLKDIDKKEHEDHVRRKGKEPS